MTATSILSLLVIAFFDYITSYEFVFSAAYLLPVALCAWTLGKRAVGAMSLASGAATWLMDLFSGHPYSHFMFHYWNSLSCFFICLVTGLLLYRLRKTLDLQHESNRALQLALAEIEESTAEIRKLQAGLQTMCAWTQRIEVDGRWMEPEEFLRTKLQLQISHGISPEAFEKIKKEIEQAGKAKEPG